MPKPTKAELIADHLTAHGYMEMTSPSRKYRKFAKGYCTLWLGKCGALREGSTSSDSTPVCYLPA